MRDGQHCFQIKLTNFTERGGVIFYNFQISLNSINIFWSERYSKLRKIAMQLPNKSIKFPPKVSFCGIKSLFLENQQFINERFQLLKQYFQNSQLTETLHKCQQFKTILQQLIKKQTMQQDIKPVKNCRSKGMKLKPKDLDWQNQYIVV